MHETYERIRNTYKKYAYGSCTDTHTQLVKNTHEKYAGTVLYEISFELSRINYGNNKLNKLWKFLFEITQTYLISRLPKLMQNTTCESDFSKVIAILLLNADHQKELSTKKIYSGEKCEIMTKIICDTSNLEKQIFLTYQWLL